MPALMAKSLSTLLLFTFTLLSLHLYSRVFMGEKFKVSRQWAVFDSRPSIIIIHSAISVSESSYLQSECDESAW